MNPFTLNETIIESKVVKIFSIIINDHCLNDNPLLVAWSTTSFRPSNQSCGLATGCLRCLDGCSPTWDDWSMVKGCDEGLNMAKPSSHPSILGLVNGRIVLRTPQFIPIDSQGFPVRDGWPVHWAKKTMTHIGWLGWPNGKGGFHQVTQFYSKGFLFTKARMKLQRTLAGK